MSNHEKPQNQATCVVDDDDNDSIATLTEDGGILTPKTESSQFSDLHAALGRMGFDNDFEEDHFEPAVPQPGMIYKIHLHGTNKVIALEEGELVLRSEGGRPGGGWFWVCTEQAGWLGFRNLVSGTFIGRDGGGGLCAEARYHRDWEYLCIRRDPRGGYQILIKHSGFGLWSSANNNLWKVSFGIDGKTLVEKQQGGAQWQFEEF